MGLEFILKTVGVDQTGLSSRGVNMASNEPSLEKCVQWIDNVRKPLRSQLDQYVPTGARNTWSRDAVGVGNGRHLRAQHGAY